MRRSEAANHVRIARLGSLMSITLTGGFRLASLAGARGLRPYIRHFFPRRRILEVKARPWQALKVGSG